MKRTFLSFEFSYTYPLPYAGNENKYIITWLKPKSRDFFLLFQSWFYAFSFTADISKAQDRYNSVAE